MSYLAKQEVGSHTEALGHHLLHLLTLCVKKPRFEGQ